MSESFESQVYALVAGIPAGSVMTYGQIALALGELNGSRRVGRAMRYAPEGLACHRVVNAKGETAPGWPEQVELLRAEGVPIQNGRVVIKKCSWWPNR